MDDEKWKRLNDLAAAASAVGDNDLQEFLAEYDHMKQVLEKTHALKKTLAANLENDDTVHRDKSFKWLFVVIEKHHALGSSGNFYCPQCLQVGIKKPDKFCSQCGAQVIWSI